MPVWTFSSERKFNIFVTSTNRIVKWLKVFLEERYNIIYDFGFTILDLSGKMQMNLRFWIYDFRFVWQDAKGVTILDLRLTIAFFLVMLNCFLSLSKDSIWWRYKWISFAELKVDDFEIDFFNFEISNHQTTWNLETGEAHRNSEA